MTSKISYIIACIDVSVVYVYMNCVARYGDISPSTVISRLFAVVWILVGLVSSAILIGGITTALTTASVLNDAKLYGTQVRTCAFVANTVLRCCVVALLQFCVVALLRC